MATGENGMGGVIALDFRWSFVVDSILWYFI